MSQIDFSIAILIIISVLTYSVISTSNKLNSDFNTFESKRIGESASALSKQLFNVEDSKSLISSFKKIQVSFQEIGGYPHTAQMNITITPVVSKIHVYDNSLNEIPSTNSSNGNNITVSFELSFNPNERKYVNIFYDGIPTTKINYTSNITETNVTSIILSEEDVYVLSQERCINLKSLSYEEAKNRFGFSDDFRISECEYGKEVPATSNVVVESVPLLVEKTDGTLYSNLVKLRVW